MGRRIRPLPGVDRAGLDGKPVGLQRDGDHHFDRRLFVVHLFHSTPRANSMMMRIGQGYGMQTVSVHAFPKVDIRVRSTIPCRHQ